MLYLFVPLLVVIRHFPPFSTNTNSLWGITIPQPVQSGVAVGPGALLPLLELKCPCPFSPHREQLERSSRLANWTISQDFNCLKEWFRDERKLCWSHHLGCLSGAFAVRCWLWFLHPSFPGWMPVLQPLIYFVKLQHAYNKWLLFKLIGVSCCYL